MRYITPTNHPSWVAPITATPGTIIEAANTAFELIHQPQHSVVNVHLPKTLMQETASIAGRNPNIRINDEPDFEFANERIIDARDFKTELSIFEIAARYGQNYAVFLRFCAALGPGRAKITSTDIDETPHFDNISPVSEVLSSNFQHMAKKSRAPKAGLTVTMALIRDGTDLVETHPDEISREYPFKDEVADFWAPELEEDIWYWKQEHPLEGRRWKNHPNTITIMRTAEWDENHPAALHNAANRKDNGNPETGIIGIANICPAG